ncbi:hypothetical protein M0L20_07735 [Spirosoma sp. RP8]|uniref:TipAS antibiotic-recognition domain-containing protein n=1 Tax=Spirosoma liriopis TaxID=2937440 RepID=A0ABT0HHV2_9BACT|nr:hypothetical protein [Spirosoma liriopis]MCK8491739.1 hypothetical protein [Spirosoma liriopis]
MEAQEALRQVAVYWEEEYTRMSQQAETFPRTGITDQDNETAAWLADVKEIYYKKYQQAKQDYMDASFGEAEELLGK